MPSQTFFSLPAAKQDHILTAASEEFAERNVSEAIVSNIVRSAGIARGSFYQYFESKEDLYVYSFETLRARRREFVEPAFAYYKAAPFLTFFEQFYLRDCEYLLAHPLHLAMGKIMYSHGTGVSLGLINAVQRRYHDIFLVGVAYDQDHGRIRPDADAALLTDLCVHFTTDIFVFQNLTTRMSMQAVRAYVTSMVDLFHRGIDGDVPLLASGGDGPPSPPGEVPPGWR